MPTVILNPGSMRINVEQGSTILQAIQKAGIPFASYCGGLGSCGKCRVLVLEGFENLNNLTKAELVHLNSRDIERNVRLACQARLEGDYISIYIPEESMSSRERSMAVVTLRDDVYPLDPMVKKIHVKVPKPTLEDNRPDFERLRELLVELGIIARNEELYIPLKVLRELPVILRKSNWDVTLVLYGREVIAVEPGDTTNHLYGVAVDIGTSKIIAELVDLSNGSFLGREFVENPQLIYGADVASRVVHAEKSIENLFKLQQLVVTAINELINKLAEKNNVDKRYIYEVMVVGNTVMHHLFFAIPPGSIARSPYVPAVSRALSYHVEEVGLAINELGYVSSLPVLRGFVGADAIADVLAVQMHRRDELTLLIDIGTNTEVLLGNSESILVASAPSGPAFEGVHITHGMRAIPGAIESIKFNGSNLEYRTIGGLKPRGICGTGLIDVIAELYRNEIINSRGKFVTTNHPRIASNEKTYKFVLVFAEESATGSDIYITPKDIEAILLAKAAVKAAWTLLLKRRNVSASEIDKVYVAGSFGTHLNVDNAIALGLLPPVDKNNVVFIGESAIVGARIALKSVKARREIEEVAKLKIRYIELSADPEFREVYLQSLRLGT